MLRCKKKFRQGHGINGCFKTLVCTELHKKQVNILKTEKLNYLYFSNEKENATISLIRGDKGDCRLQNPITLIQ